MQTQVTRVPPAPTTQHANAPVDEHTSERAMSAASSTIASPASAAVWSSRRRARRSCSSSSNNKLRTPTMRIVARSIAEPTAPSVATKGGVAQKAIVVGGGVGGLGMASRLANAGYEVTILEKNPDVGGRCRSESFEGGGEGYRFDTGPSLMLLPDRYREQFTAVGKKLEVRSEP